VSWLRAVALLGLVSLPGVASAALPLETEDTGTTERVEVELAATYLSAPDGSGAELGAGVGVGLRGNLEVAIVGTLALADPAGGEIETGPGDSFLTVKYRFVDEAAPWPALLARLALRFPIGDETRGLGEGDVHVQLLLAGSRTLGPVTLTGNVGYTVTTGDADADTVFLGASAEWAVGGAWRLVGEVVGEVAVGRTAADVAVARVGFTWDVFDAGEAPGLLRKVTLAGAVGVGLTAASPDVTAVLGLTLQY
jgi:hypothetical protein